MPGQGSMLGIFPDMSEKEHRILEVGIPLFQLVYPKPVWFPMSVQNFFGVRVESPDPDFRNAQHSVEWFSGGDAHITFNPANKAGLGIAWVPDDPWMHNRMIFMTNENPPFPYKKWIKQLRRPNGELLQAAECLFEIACMDKVLRKSVPLWNVFKNGKNLCPFKSEKEAKAFIDDQGGTEIKLDKKSGTLQPLKVNKNKFTIEEGERREWKAEIATLIDREKNKHRYGWTESREFMEKWKPLIFETIQKERNEFNEKNETADVKAAVSEIDINNLSDEALDALSRRLNSRQRERNKRRVGRPPKKQEVEEVAR